MPPYTQLAAVLYEALDALLWQNHHKSDVHLRNLCPHSMWTPGFVYSEGQGRHLAATAPPPRVFQDGLSLLSKVKCWPPMELYVKTFPYFFSDSCALLIDAGSPSRTEG